MKDAARIRSMFASVSRRYDFLNHLLSLNQDKRWRRKTVEMSGLDQDSRVLDVCAGTADLAIAYSRSLTSGGVVIGTDFCPEMLVIGKRKISSHGNGSLSVPPDRAEARIELLVADTLRLPFDDGMFDVVSVAFGIRNVSDFEAGIREMTRVAKPGGRVVILEFSMPGNRFFGKVYTMYFTRALPAIGRLVSRSGNDAYSYLPNSVMEFPSGSEMCGVMERCGLANVSATELSFGIVSLYVGHKPGTGSKNGG